MGTQCYVFFTQFFEDGGGSILLIIHVLDMVLVSLSRARGKSIVELISNTNWTNSFWSGCESESVFQLMYIYFLQWILQISIVWMFVLQSSHH